MKLISLSVLIALAASSFPNMATDIKRANSSSAREIIKVYQTPNNEGSITIHSAMQQSLNFYLFNLEGKLIYQTKINQNEKQMVEGLTKGTYLYNAFENDKNLEGGKVILK